MVKLKAFVPFKSAEEALANINDISEGEWGCCTCCCCRRCSC